MNHPPASEANVVLVRNLVSKGGIATLGTIEQRGEGEPISPFVSLVTYAVTGFDRIAMLLSGLAKHTANLNDCKFVSLLICDAESGDGDPMASSRVTLSGRVTCLSRESDTAVREKFLERHPAAEVYVGFGDFAFYEIEIDRADLVGGFGNIQTIPGNELQLA